MTFNEIVTLLQNQFGGDCFTQIQPNNLQPFIALSPEYLVQVCTFLRDAPQLYFDMLACLSGVDYGNAQYGVVYHLVSITRGLQLTLKCNAIDTQLPSIASVWRAADWHEREAYDLFGIVFLNHPDLRRIILPDDWEGFPLRKNYQVPPTYQGIPTTSE